MGSSGSKIDNSEAVTLCHGRSECLSKAIGFRYAFSNAHVAYFRSLKSVSESLNQFIDGIDTMCNVVSDDKLGADKDNKLTTDVKETAEEKNVAMLRIKCYNSLSKAAAVIKTQLGNASESATEISEIIEVGKCQYHHKLSLHKRGFDVQAFFKNVMSGACSRLLSKNHLLITNGNMYEHFGLASTLQKLIIWERNLYDEVVKEEKMQFTYGMKFKEMKQFIGKSAEQQKVDPVILRVPNKLSIMVGMSIEVIYTISAYITMLRDERLCPKVCQLIKGLAKMWSSMYECYKTLHQAIEEENFLQYFSCGDSDAQLESIKQLGLELIELTENFSNWINAQKDFIKALNDWLLIDVRRAEEETTDEVAPSVAPFSPSSSRLGTPIFVICNQWYQSIQNVSEEEVIISMLSFSSAVLSLWKKKKAEQCQKLMADRDTQRGHKIMKREEKEMSRIVKAWSKKLTYISGQNGIVMLEENADEINLHVGLLQLFESMENYSAANLKVYDELDVRIEEEHARAD